MTCIKILFAQLGNAIKIGNAIKLGVSFKIFIPAYVLWLNFKFWIEAPDMKNSNDFYFQERSIWKLGGGGVIQADLVELDKDASTKFIKYFILMSGALMLQSWALLIK